MFPVFILCLLHKKSLLEGTDDLITFYVIPCNGHAKKEARAHADLLKQRMRQFHNVTMADFGCNTWEQFFIGVINTLFHHLLLYVCKYNPCEQIIG